MTAKKRIIHTVTNDLNFDQRMQRICTSLTRAGFDCLLVGREKRGSAPLGAQIFQQKRLYCFFERGPLFYTEFNIRLFIFLLVNKFDCVNTIDLDTMPAGCLIGPIKNKKRVFDAHEYFSEVPEVYNRKFVKKCWELIAKICIPYYHKCYTVGDYLAGIFTEIYGKKFEVIRNAPFKSEHIEPVTLSHRLNQLPIIFYQGALNKGRGLEGAILAMKQLDFAELWLAGEGDLSEKLRQLVAENGLENRVKFLGSVRPDELRALTKKAWLGLNLLEMNGLSYYYSLANKFFDYLQNGVPSLNMNFPEYQKINAAHEVGLLLENCEAEAIATAIILLKNDKSLYQKLVKNCGEAAKIYHWEKEGAVLIKLYNARNYTAGSPSGTECW